MLKDTFIFLMTEHRGKFFGTIAGLIMAILFLGLGFWRTLLLIAFIATGYLIGRDLDGNYSGVNFLKNLFKKK